MTYIYKVKNGYQIQKRIGDKMVHYGYFKTLKEAEEELKILIKNDWEWDRIVEEEVD